MIPLTESTFRRLAQSSPWRFRTLHVTWRPQGRLEPVEAWLTRPGHLRVHSADGTEHIVEGVPYGMSVLTIGGPHVEPPPPVSPDRAAPEVDEHGLVVARPELAGEAIVAYDDPMWQDYTWVAMLDPRELATGTAVFDLMTDDRYGRETWWAQVAAISDDEEDGYNPRCGCCPLIWGEVSERIEGSIGGPTYAEQHPDVVYPASWLIGLDVETGVVVSASPTGGSRPDCGFELTIHDVG